MAHGLGVKLPVGLVALLLISCPNPIPVELANQIADETGPLIIIEEPTDGSAYGSLVQVIGTITDRTGDSGEGGLPPIECSYSVAGTSIGGSISPAEDGSFSFHFQTTDESGGQLVGGVAIIHVTATDWNGNTTVASIQLVPSQTGEIPGFEVRAYNHSVTIAWDEVPFATTYDIVEYNFGILVENAKTPCVVDGLANGRTHVFQLRAKLGEPMDTTLESSRVSAMPLSTRTFAPMVAETQYKSVRLEWWPSPDVATYTVERRIPGSTDWAIQLSTPENSYLDTNVEHDTRYQYRISCAERPDVVSETITAVPGRLGVGILSSLGLGAFPLTISVDGTTAYIALDETGLAVVDVTEPEEPLLMTVIDAFDGLGRTLVHDGIAYVGQSTDIEIWDVSAPAEPSFLSRVSMGQSVGALSMSWPYLYVPLSSPSQLAIVDVEDPEDPVGPYFFDLAHGAGFVDVHGDYAYVWCTDDVFVVGVADPSSPTGPFPMAVPGWIDGLCVDFPRAYVLSFDEGNAKSSLLTYNVENPETPVLLTSRELDQTCGNPLEVVDSFLVARHGMRGLSVFGLANPDDPVFLSTVDTGHSVRNAAVSGSEVFAVTQANDLKVIEFAVPTHTPQMTQVLAGHWDTVCTNGTLLFVAADGGAAATLDISDPDAPILLAESDIGDGGVCWSYCTDVCVFSDLLSGGFLIDEISDDGSLAHAAYAAAFVGTTGGLAIFGDMVYKATLFDGIAAVDVSVPASPNLVCLTPTAGACVSIAVGYPFAYVVFRLGGVGLSDITDLANPTIPDTFPVTPGEYPDNIAITGDRAYVASYNNEWTGSLQVMDISGETDPVVLKSFPLDGDDPGRPCVVGPYVLVSLAGEGIAIVDTAASPTDTGCVRYITGVGVARDVVVVGSHAFAATTTGLKSLRLWGE
jgi:hypothetical protein